MRALLKSDPRDLWPLRHLFRVIRRHNLTKKTTKTNTQTKTMTMTKTNTFREPLQRAIIETCELWDIWSEWWGDMTWPTKRQLQRQRQRHCDLWDTDYISDNWEQQSQHSGLPLNKEWQEEHSQFLRCFLNMWTILKLKL